MSICGAKIFTHLREIVIFVLGYFYASYCAHICKLVNFHGKCTFYTPAIISYQINN